MTNFMIFKMQNNLVIFAKKSLGTLFNIIELKTLLDLYSNATPNILLAKYNRKSARKSVLLLKLGLAIFNILENKDEISSAAEQKPLNF
jgi:hypothetical protein